MFLLASYSTNGANSSLSIDGVNAIVALLSLIVAVVAVTFAVRADKTAWTAKMITNRICEMQRIDRLMPNVLISSFKAFSSLHIQRYPFLDIVSIDELPANSNQYCLNNIQNIAKNELEWILKIEMTVINHSLSSTLLSIEIDGFDKKNISLYGMECFVAAFECNQRALSLKMAQSLIDGHLSLPYRITCKGIGTESCDIINGTFCVVYCTISNEQTLVNVEFKSNKERKYI